MSTLALCEVAMRSLVTLPVKYNPSAPNIPPTNVVYIAEKPNQAPARVAPRNINIRAMSVIVNFWDLRNFCISIDRKEGPGYS